MTRNYSASPEAQSIRQQRRTLRRAQHDDLLLERAKKIAFWKKCAETNRHYLPHNGAWWWVFTWQPWGIRLLLPRLRARIEAGLRARDEEYRAELREYAQRWARTKAQRAAAKAQAKRDAASGQSNLLEGTC